MITIKRRVRVSLVAGLFSRLKIAFVSNTITSKKDDYYYGHSLKRQAKPGTRAEKGRAKRRDEGAAEKEGAE